MVGSTKDNFYDHLHRECWPLSRRALGLAMVSALTVMTRGPTATDARADSGKSADDVSEIAPGVFVHRGVHGVYAPQNGGDICNTGFVIGSEAVAVIDTGGTARLGAAMRKNIAAHTDRPIRYVINTHMHPDHVLGNAAFKADNPVFVGHHKLAAALSARADRYLAYNKASVGDALFAGTEIVLPTQPVAQRTELDLGGRRLILEPRSTAHTDNDLTVSCTQTDTMFTGDLVFSGHVPTLDGSIRGWIALLADLTKEPIVRIVPGHGPAAMDWPAAARPLQRYLDAVASGVRMAIRKGETMSTAIAKVAQDERANWELFDEFHGRNVSAAFAELEWE